MLLEGYGSVHIVVDSETGGPKTYGSGSGTLLKTFDVRREGKVNFLSVFPIQQSLSAVPAPGQDPGLPSQYGRSKIFLLR